MIFYICVMHLKIRTFDFNDLIVFESFEFPVMMMGAVRNLYSRCAIQAIVADFYVVCLFFYYLPATFVLITNKNRITFPL